MFQIFGGRGFVGSRYRSLYPNRIIFANDRDDRSIVHQDILYMISTVHNYNVFEDPHLDINTNLNVLVDVLDNWKLYQRTFNKQGTFNFISSWFVYGDQKDLGVKEDSYCNPKGFYSITKRAAEQLLISYCETFGLNYRILRLGNVIGPGDSKVSSKKNALQYLVNKLKNNEDIEIYDDGRFHRDYISVDDCCDAINLVITKGNQDEIYNIGNGKSWQFKDILYYTRRLLNSKSKINFVPAKPFHDIVQVKSFYMDNSKIQNLGYKPNHTNEKLFDLLLI